MKTIQASEAKAKFLSLLSEAERGETIEITRHGRAVAKIVPIDSAYERRVKAAQAIRDYKNSGVRTGITIEDILSARDEGRP
jgi:prevent-host-death family protein